MIKKEDFTVVFSGSHCMAVLREGDRPVVGDRTRRVANINRYRTVVKAELADGTVIKRDISGDHLDKSNKKRVEFGLSEGVAAERICNGYMVEELVPWYVATQFAGEDPVILLKFCEGVRYKPKMEIYEKDGYYFVYTTPQGPDLAYERKENVREKILDVTRGADFILKRDDLGLFADKEHTGKILSRAI